MVKMTRRQKETNLWMDQQTKELTDDASFPLAIVADVDSLETKFDDLRRQECVVSVSLSTYPIPI